MPISSRVDVTVVDETPTEGVPSFNIPMVLGTSGIPEIADEVIVLSSMLDVPDAVDPTTEEYQALQKIFAQSPHADKVYLFSVDRSHYSVGELETGSGETLITWRSRNEGNAAENVQVEIDPVDSHDLAVEFYKQLLIGDGGNTNYMLDEFSSEPSGAVKLTTKQPDYDRVYSVEVATATSQSEVGIAMEDTNGDGDPDKLTITVDDAGAHTVADVVSAVNNDSEASAFFVAESVNDETTAFSTTVATTNVPFSVRAIPETDSSGTIISTAEEVAQEVNDYEASDASLVVHADSTGSDSVSAVGPSALTLVSDSPASMVRALDTALENLEENNMEKPYFLVSTTYGDSSEAEEVEGDRIELANAVATRKMIYGTSNQAGESATEARVLANTMASDRAFVFAHKNKDTGREYPEACLIGKWSGHDITTGNLFDPMWSPLQSLTTSKYNTTEQNRLEDDAPLNSAAFTYAPAKDTAVVTGSWSTSGEYLDWRQQKDYIEEYVETAIVNELTSSAIVQGDSRGLAQMQSTVEDAFSHLVSLGIIGINESGGGSVPMYSLEFPSLDEWSELNRAERHFIASATVSPAWALEQFDLTVYATLETEGF